MKPIGGKGHVNPPGALTVLPANKEDLVKRMILHRKPGFFDKMLSLSYFFTGLSPTGGRPNGGGRAEVQS